MSLVTASFRCGRGKLPAAGRSAISTRQGGYHTRMRPVRAYDRRHDPTLTQDEQESRAYVLIEEARLRCERLASAETNGWLSDLHREVGMAGLCASARLEGWARQILLEAARVRSESPIRGVPDAETTVEIALGRARTAVEQCLTMPEKADHMRQAHVHLRAARDLLGFHRLDSAAEFS